MKSKQWRDELKFFLTEHPDLYPNAGDIYTPQSHIEITFLFNGCPPITGKHSSLEVNFNSDVFLILSEGNVVTRILWEVFTGFQLKQIEPKDTPNVKLYVVPKN